MDSELINVLYKYAIVPLCIVFWWFFKKIDYRLERNELANHTIQKEFELRMQTIEKAFELRLSVVEKTVLVVTTRLDTIKEDLQEIKAAQKELMGYFTETKKREIPLK